MSDQREEPPEENAIRATLSPRLEGHFLRTSFSADAFQNDSVRHSTLTRKLRISRRMPAMCQRSFQSAFRARRWSMTRPPAVAARSSCRSALILVLFCFSNNLYGGGAKIFHGLLGLTSYPEALHNLDFAASVSHFPCPPLAKFQAFSWRGLSETLAMSPLAHHYAAISLRWNLILSTPSAFWRFGFPDRMRANSVIGLQRERAGGISRSFDIRNAFEPMYPRGG